MQAARFIDPIAEETQAPTQAQNNNTPQQQVQETKPTNTSGFIDPVEEDKQTNLSIKQNDSGGVLDTIYKIDANIGAIPKAFWNELGNQGEGVIQLALLGLNKLGVVPDEYLQQYSDGVKAYRTQENAELSKTPVGQAVGEALGMGVGLVGIGKVPSGIKAGTEAIAKIAPNVVTKKAAEIGAKSGVGYAEAGAIGANLQYVPNEDSRIPLTAGGAAFAYGVGKAGEKIAARAAAKEALKNEQLSEGAARRSDEVLAAEAKVAQEAAEAKAAQVDDGIDLYHGSRGSNADDLNVTEAGPYQVFDGIFAGDKATARSHGDNLYHINMPKKDILTTGILRSSAETYPRLKEIISPLARVNGIKKITNDELEAFYEGIVDESNVNNELIWRLSRFYKNADVGEIRWDLQNLRGRLAKNMGYKAVETLDEHGTSYYILPGAKLKNTKVQQAANDAQPIFTKPNIQPDRATMPSSQYGFADDADELGIRYSKGDASQDFTQQQFESNASKMADVGDEMRAFRQGQQEDIIEAGGRIAGKYGAGNKVAAGAQLQKTMRDTVRSEKKDISEAYEIAKQAKGNDAIVPTDDLKPKVAEVVDDFEDVIPSPIVKKLQKFGIMDNPEKAGKAGDELLDDAVDDTVKFTVADAEKLVKSINRRMNATNDPATKEGLRQLKSHVDETIGSLAQTDDEAVALYHQARTKRAKLADTFQQEDIVQAIVDKKAKFTNYVDPQKVVDKIVKDSAHNLENIPRIKKALMQSGAEGVKAWNGLRASVVDDLISGSVKGADTGQAYFDTARFNREATKIGDDALKQLLTPGELVEFKKFQRVISQIQRKAPGAVNNSNTATALANLVTQSPLLSGYLGGFLKAAGRKVTRYRDMGKINEAIKGGRRPTESAVKQAQEKLKPTTNPLLKLLSAGAGRAVTNQDDD